MTILSLFALFFAGIVLSVLVPIAAKWVIDARSGLAKGDTWEKVRAFAAPILRMAAGSAVLGFFLVLIFLAGGGESRRGRLV